MADNTELDAGSGGDTIASDDIGGVKFQRVKLIHGIDGVNSGDISSTNPLPVNVSGGTITVAGTVDVGNMSSIATEATAAAILARLTTVSTTISTITTPVQKVAIYDSGGSQIESFGGGTQYVEGATTTLPTGTVVLWKSAVSTIVPASTSNPWPVQGLGNMSSLATELSAASSVSLASTIALRLLAVSSTTASTVSLASTISLRLSDISTTTASTVALLSTNISRLLAISSNTASTNIILGGALASSSGAIWVQAVPGAAQSTVAATDLIRVGVFGTSDNQITSFGSGTQYVEGNTTTLATGTVIIWKSAVSTLVAVSSSQPLPVQGLGNLSSLATQLSMGNVSTFTNSTNTLLIHVSSNTASTNAMLSSVIASGELKVSIETDNVGIGGGTQYVDGATSTAPTGTVMMWKSAVSTLVPVTSSLGLPVNVIAGSLSANQQYVEGATSTNPTGIVMLWKSAVSTLRAASTSDPLPVSSLPITANIGTIGTIATQATLAAISTYQHSSVAMISTLGLQATLAEISTYTASTVSLASTIALRALSTNTLLVQVSSNTASTNALLSTQTLRLENISTFTNSTNTLLVHVSSTTASTVSLASTIALRLAPVPTGIYVQPVGVSSNGLSTFMTLDADETEEQISATACTVYGMWATNLGSVAAFLKLYNGTSSAIFVSSATPLVTIAIPGNATDDISGVFNVGGIGIAFSTACCVAAVTSAAIGNVSAPAESTVICNVFYKN